MLKSVSFKNFKAIPYLEETPLLTSHKGEVPLSTTKPNILVGPNGAGKSSFLKALALKTFSYYGGETNFDRHYCSNGHRTEYWTKKSTWGNDWDYLEGLSVQGSIAPSWYFRPGFIPGDECSFTHAMMTGYFDQAKKLARLVEHKSSGQATSAMLQELLTTLDNPVALKHASWKAPEEASYRLDANTFREYAVRAQLASLDHASRLILLDEPEQSLDAKSQVMVWKELSTTWAKKAQIVVATHSLYPLLFPEQFNVIEAEPGYCDSVREALA